MRNCRKWSWGVAALVLVLLAGWLWPLAGATVAKPAKPSAAAVKADAKGGDKAGEGGEAEGDAAGEGKGAADKKPAPTPVAYTLGPTLGDHFDSSVLRSLQRVSKLRYPVDKLDVDLGGSHPRSVQVSVVVEFGAETGMAELQAHETDARDSLRKIIAKYSVEQLVDGRFRTRIAEQWIAQLNRRFTTAHVRQTYFTDFKIGR